MWALLLFETLVSLYLQVPLFVYWFYGAVSAGPFDL